jgi:nickel-dependent lactate racemase
MPIEMHYGDEQVLHMDLAPETHVTDASRPRGTPLDDPASAVAAALTDPLGFPPFSQAVLPGDRVAVAVERGIPQTPTIVAGAVHAVLGGGASAKDITLVLAPATTEESARLAVSQLPLEVREQVNITIHRPDQIDDCCYLAASKDGHPVYFNRQIGEADVVLPIVALRLEQSLGYAGILGGLFPAFSDRATMERFRAPTTAEWSVHQRRRREEADEAAWLLGIQCALYIAPGPGNSVLHVLAGDAKAVADHGRTLCEAAWLHRGPNRASLVVATIEGNADQQTWENFARALYAATHAVRDGGSILICSNLQGAPGPALMQLAGAVENDAELERNLRRERSEDAISATLLALAQRRSQVYLLSGLNGEVVEDLGLGHVEDEEDVRRLSAQHRSCILLGNAQFAMFSADDE